jgi:hypothetical protein|tara:strand:- start:1379 stop:1675 length:297 start_codon:yes stop_codon:yes gene_type:complete
MSETNTADIAPAFTYEWTDAEQATLRRTDADGNVAFVPTDPRNRDYDEFLSSGAEAAPYVAPPEPEPETTEQKVDHLLSDYGLTREEMQAALDVKDDE